MAETTLALKARIAELERLAESYRYAADRLADELISILKPYRDGDPLTTALAIREIAGRHQCGASRELH